MKDQIKKALKAVVILSLLAVLVCGCQSLKNWFRGDPGPNFLLADSQLSHGDIQQFYESVKPRKNGNTEQLFKIAGHLKRSGKHLAAIETLKDILSIDPTNTRAYNDMGISYDQIGEYRAAAGCYHRALKIDSNLDYVYNNLGYSYLTQGKLSAAIGAFSHAIQLNPDNPRYHNNLGLAYGKKGVYERAGEAFKLAGGDAAARRNLAILRSHDNKQLSTRPGASQTDSLKIAALKTIARPYLGKGTEITKGIDVQPSADEQKITLLPMKIVTADRTAKGRRQVPVDAPRPDMPEKAVHDFNPETVLSSTQRLDHLSPEQAKSLFLTPIAKRAPIGSEREGDTESAEYRLSAALDPTDASAGTLIKSFKLQINKSNAPGAMVGISLKRLNKALQETDAAPNSNQPSLVSLLPPVEIPEGRSHRFELSATEGEESIQSAGLLRLHF